MIPAPITLAILAVAYLALCFGLPMALRWLLRAVDDPTDPDNATCALCQASVWHVGRLCPFDHCPASLTHPFNHRGNNLSDTSGAKVTGRTHGEAQ